MTPIVRIPKALLPRITAACPGVPLREAVRVLVERAMDAIEAGR